MLYAIIPAPTTPDFAPALYRPAANLARPTATGRALPLREVGTGGVAGLSFVLDGLGYHPFELHGTAQQIEEAPYAKLMQQVKGGFGRTMSRLPEVFGVSRQTLYNWLDGETPKPAHQQRLVQLAQAAQVFSNLGFKPTTEMLDRNLTGGKSFIQLLASEANGKETAMRLVRVVQRGQESRTKLDQLLGGRKAPLTASDIGAPALNEDA